MVSFEPLPELSLNQNLDMEEKDGSSADIPRDGSPPRLTALIREAAKRTAVTMGELQRSTA